MAKKKTLKPNSVEIKLSSLALLRRALLSNFDGYNCVGTFKLKVVRNMKAVNILFDETVTILEKEGKAYIDAVTALREEFAQKDDKGKAIENPNMRWMVLDFIERPSYNPIEGKEDELSDKLEELQETHSKSYKKCEKLLEANTELLNIVKFNVNEYDGEKDSKKDFIPIGVIAELDILTN